MWLLTAVSLVRAQLEEPIMSSVAAGGRKLLKVVGIDLKVKLPPTDTIKIDRYVAKWLDDLCQIKKKQSKLSEK